MQTRIGQVYQETRSFLIPYFMLLLACIILRLIYTRNELFFGVNDWHGLAADRFFRTWTNLGDWFVVVLIVFITLFFSYRKALLIAVSSVTATFVGQVLKHYIHFPRPRMFYSNYFDDKGLSPKIYYVPTVAMLSNSSFPSGHTITAFTLGLLFAYFMRQKQFGLILLIMAALVGFSRMYLKQHFFEDAVAGSLIGISVSFFMLVWLGKKPFFNTIKWNAGLLKF